MRMIPSEFWIANDIFQTINEILNEQIYPDGKFQFSKRKNIQSMKTTLILIFQTFAGQTFKPRQ
jgi:hypothetical protein